MSRSSARDAAEPRSVRGGLVPWLVAFATLGSWSCGEATSSSPPAPSRAHAAALERSFNDYPSHQERLLLYLTNKVKSDPAAFNPSDPYDPTPPMAWDLALSKAARFHARDIAEQGCWCEDHSSCCELEGMGDETTCASAPTGCGAASAGDRVGRFSPNYSGENMATGQASATAALDAWINSEGHWWNINQPHGLLGVGNVDRAWVQDFGDGGNAIRVIGDGIHERVGAKTRFGITYYQPGTGGPQAALVVVDGECHELEFVAGSLEHGALEAELALGGGCHRYVFVVRDGQGIDHTYPSQGSFATGDSSDSDCPFYREERPAETCTPAGQPCQTGDVRSCYTGTFGTRDVGACESGSERCVAGQWTGECRYQVTPAAEACEDEVDNDCDGEVDEGCMGGHDAPSIGPPDMGEAGSPPGAPPTDQGCSQAAPSGALTPWFLGLFLVLGRRRRRRQRPTR